MTASRSYRIDDFVGIRVSGGSSDFPDLATGQTVPLGALDPHRVVTLLRAADAAAFFTREEPPTGATGPDVRIWHVRLCHGGRARLLAFTEPFPDPAITMLIRLARDCLSARRTMGIDEVSQALRDAVAASRAPPESAAFNHEVEPVADRPNGQSGDGIVCGVSGWFSPHGVRYHEDVRSVSQIAPADWSALLDHADAIDFFDRPEPAPPGPSDRIFHLTITAGNRHRELAINDPFETHELAHLITLTRRAVRDRQVLSPEMLDDEQFAALATAWLNAQAADPDDGPGR